MRIYISEYEFYSVATHFLHNLLILHFIFVSLFWKKHVLFSQGSIQKLNIFGKIKLKKLEIVGKIISF